MVGLSRAVVQAMRMRSVLRVIEYFMAFSVFRVKRFSDCGVVGELAAFAIFFFNTQFFC